MLVGDAILVLVVRAGARVPRAVALAWGIAADPQRGPKRELTIERIVEVAVRLADDGGLSAVSMAAIAGELGVTSMALYRYVTSKDDLLVLMQEEGIGLPPESIREADVMHEVAQKICAAAEMNSTSPPQLVPSAVLKM